MTMFTNHDNVHTRVLQLLLRFNLVCHKLERNTELHQQSTAATRVSGICSKSKKEKHGRRDKTEDFLETAKEELPLRCQNLVPITRLAHKVR